MTAKRAEFPLTPTAARVLSALSDTDWACLLGVARSFLPKATRKALRVSRGRLLTPAQERGLRRHKYAWRIDGPKDRKLMADSPRPDA